MLWQIGALQARHHAAIAAAGQDVDAVVLAPLRAVREALHVEHFQAGAEAGEDLLAHVGLARRLRCP